MTTDDKNYLLLYSFCKIVRGGQQSIICDLQHNRLKSIPHELESVVNMLRKQPFQIVKNIFKGVDAKIFDSYTTFLLKNKFAFFTLHPERFPEIVSEWKSPEKINNAIIEYSFQNYNLLDILNSLECMQTKFIEFRFTTLHENNKNELQQIFSFCQNSMLRSCRVYIPSNNEKSNKEVIELLYKYSVIDTIVFYQHKIPKHFNIQSINIVYITESLNEITVAQVSDSYLVNNIQYFYEAHTFNPYYNKKVSIDRQGNIKNCIKNIAVFGNVNIDDLEIIISTDSFREFWHINHDKITDIADSEFRYHRIITNDLQKLPCGNYKLI